MAQTNTAPMDVLPRQSDDVVKLIRKLRWIGREEDAQQLLLAVRKLPPEHRGTVSVDQVDTDWRSNQC